MELNDIKGLGKKRIELLEEKGIKSVQDLVLYFPKTYYNLESKDTFIEDGKYKLLSCEVISDVKVVRIKKNFNYSVATCLDLRSVPFKAIWYNQPYIKNAVKNGDKLFLYGKNSSTKHGYFVVSSFKNQNKVSSGTKLLAVYKTYKNLGQSVISSSIGEALTMCKLNSILPSDFSCEEIEMDLQTAIKSVHAPEDLSSLQKAKTRVEIEKILPIIKINSDIKNKKNLQKQQKYSNISHIFDEFCSFLPYELTPSQKKVIAKISSEMSQKKLLSRLLQGDVGSGKTIVALFLAVVALKNGYSAIFVAPTQILASQHYALAKSLLEKMNLDVSFLSSSSKTSERREVIEKLKTSPTLLIGTHSCFSSEIPLDNVSLVIIDEQHRFGVKQRSTILNRSKSCDLLMLSATPIPRSMSIVYYGGLDISILSAPPYKKKIQTNLVAPAKENDLWNFVGEKIESGSKVYVVCANIDDADDDCYQGLSVKSMYDFLCKRFSKEKVLMAHGRFSAEEEEKTLDKFKNGEEAILVSTTIVEVGVDIARADIMILVSPEKFGLATLHQLRGRIGRAGQQSFCFCLTRNVSPTSKDRIVYFKEHDNGFDIAEYDYSSRGAGEILSTKQHGKIDNPFDLVGLDALKKASSVFEKLEATYGDTSFLLSGAVYDKNLEDIGLN